MKYRFYIHIRCSKQTGNKCVTGFPINALELNNNIKKARFPYSVSKKYNL